VKWKAWHVSKEKDKHLSCKPAPKPIRPLYKLPTWPPNKQRKPMLRQQLQQGKGSEWFSTLGHNLQTQRLQEVAAF
jgi:hypothetical protein